MSLKAFHVAFVTISTLLAIFVTVWAVHRLQAGAGGATLAMAIVGGLGALGLPVYGVWFLDKTKNISFL